MGDQNSRMTFDLFSFNRLRAIKSISYKQNEFVYDVIYLVIKNNYENN